ncbi:hypothetical protein CMK12_17360 [Candidatus Poribacteria bacterium]|nr:hypothetical protein [Candidatus Poribacteria bacterium]
MTFDTGILQADEKVTRGCRYGSARTREDFPRLVELYMAGKLKNDELITHEYTLEESNEAFRALARGDDYVLIRLEASASFTHLPRISVMLCCGVLVVCCLPKSLHLFVLFIRRIPR